MPYQAARRFVQNHVIGGAAPIALTGGAYILLYALAASLCHDRQEALLAGARRTSSALAAGLVLSLFLTAWPLGARAEDIDPEESPPAAANAGPSAIKTSGLPVPRFVTIRSNEVNARTGPSTKYPIEWVFSRRGMPVEVVAEFDTWRRIRDLEGGEGWVMQGMLSPKRAVMIQGEPRTLRREPAPSGRPIARAEPGVIGQVLHIKDDWCEVTIEGYRGWLPRAEVWGIYAGERLE